MAQSTQEAQGTASRTNGTDTTALAVAWCKAATARKYRVENGVVWDGVGGMLYPLPPLAGFNSLPEAVQPFVFHATAQFANYRIGQTAEGDVGAAIAKAMAGDIPNAKSNDAFESLYLSRIGALIKKAKPDAEISRADLEATAEQYRDHAKVGIVATVLAGKAATTREAKERKRVAAKKTAATDLGALAE